MPEREGLVVVGCVLRSPGRRERVMGCNCEWPCSCGSEITRLRTALYDIATRPVVERNPDGEDQAAWTMQMIAAEAIGLDIPPNEVRLTTYTEEEA